MKNLKQALDTSNRIPALMLDAEKVAHGFMRGIHGRRKAGIGESFWQFRKWQHGDSVTSIDWKQTAKSDDIYVREMEWEAAQAIWIYRSPSVTMNFSSSNKCKTKKDYAEVLLLSLAIVMLEAGEQVGLLGTDLPLQLHVQSIAKIAHNLEHQQSFNHGMKISRNSQVIIISDFFDDMTELKKLCYGLAQNNIKGVLLQVNDITEENMTYRGKVKFKNMLGEGEKIIPSVKDISGEYREKFLAYRSSINDFAESLGWKFVAVNTRQKPEAVLFEIYKLLAVKK